MTLTLQNVNLHLSQVSSLKSVLEALELVRGVNDVLRSHFAVRIIYLFPLREQLRFLSFLWEQVFTFGAPCGVSISHGME
jgi:hypothetical protein